MAALRQSAIDAVATDGETSALCQTVTRLASAEITAACSHPTRLFLSASAARAAVDADEVRERRDQAQHPAYADKEKGKEKRKETSAAARTRGG